MAYYSYPYSASDYGEYNFNSYASSTYDYAQVPTYMSYNSYEYNKPYYGYDQSLYLSTNYPAQSYQTSISYSATNFTDPKSFEYDPNHGMTQLVISYNTVEFNAPEFDDYDPTPYGGGYDISETYGKPLPPSDEICYPPSTRSSSITPPSDAVPVGPIVPLPIVDEAIEEKAIIPQKETEEIPQSQDSSKDQPEVAEDQNYDTSEESESEDEDDNYNHSEPGYGNGYSGGNSDEYEKKVPAQYPSGYGLEAMDLCETLFGYWPCLSRMKREQHRCEAAPPHRGNYYCQDNIYKEASDYLFGNPYPYGGRGEDEGSGYGHVGGGGGGELVHSYERHYPTQAYYYRQSEYNDGSSW